VLPPALHALHAATPGAQRASKDWLIVQASHKHAKGEASANANEERDQSGETNGYEHDGSLTLARAYSVAVMTECT
jgi:hypothetical protein